MIKVLATGCNGLVGTRIQELLSKTYEFESVSRSTGVDITDTASIEKRTQESDASLILHLAAKADVDGCEHDKSLGEDGEAHRINVIGTQNIADCARRFGKKLIYISTDFVFDGEKPLGESYEEEDHPAPINWYGVTKYEGEKIVGNLSTPWVIARIAYPYRATFTKKDFFRTILERLSQNQEVLAIEDHVMTPTFIDDIAGALDVLIRENATGTFHVVGSEFISPFDIAKRIAKAFGLRADLIKKTTRSEFFMGRAPRPFNLALKNDKIEKLGVRMKSFDESLQDIIKQ